MPHPTMPAPALDPLLHDLPRRLTAVVQQLTAWVAQSTPDLQQLEEQVLCTLKELGGVLLVGLVQQLVPLDPPRTHPCPCGAAAAFQRLRPATCRTVLGPLTVTRPYYLCSACHRGCAPFDQLLGWCAGSRSAGLDELLALLGATQDSFAEAAHVLDRLTFVQVAPNTVRAATDELGPCLADVEHTQIAALQTGEPPVHVAPPAAGPMCVSLDGVQAHLTPEGWKEVCVGVVYQVRPGRPGQERRADAVQATALSYVAELGSHRDEFGWQLYAEALRRGAGMREVVVVGDGAHWLWDLAELHFPEATQILDWFHATEYVWSAARAVWTEDAPMRTQWAEQQLCALWDGKVDEVLVEVARHVACGEAVAAAQTYFTNQQQRMDYPTYRARGLPLGSGTVESGCKQVVSSRLKGAGMIWGTEGARQVVKVRAWLKSGRWQEAMALRGVRRRRCRRQAGSGQSVPAAASVPAVVKAVDARSPRGLSAEVLALVRDELRRPQVRHPWRQPWSPKQQRASRAVPPVRPMLVSSA